MLCKFWGAPGFILKSVMVFYNSMEDFYDTFEYETLQEEMALEMAAEALVEQNILDYADQESDDCDYYDDDPYDEWGEVENREMLGIEAYSHWNEEAAHMWWMEEGRHQ